MKFAHLHIKTISAGIMMATLAGGFSAIPANAAPSALAPAASVSTVLAPMSTQSDTFAKRTFDLINIERSKVGSRPLVWNQKISDVSQDWSNQISQKTMDGTFDFNTIHRADAGGSLIPAGATWYRENIAFNFTPEQVVDWWMNSPGHKAAMLDPKATDIGVGYTVPSSGPYAGWKLTVTNLAAYPTTAIPSTPSTSIPAGTQYKTTIQLNLRSGPGTNYAILGSGVTGTIVTATGKTSDIWYEVKMGSQTGWMSSEYLTKYADAAPAPVTKSAIATKAAQINGYLGSAVGPEVYGLKDGGAYQNYQYGAIMWSPAYGAFVSNGAIRSLWASKGFENGVLGYPTSDEVSGLKNGGVYQNYQGGAVLWSPATGAHISAGPIRNKWAATGFEGGALGYPVSDIVTGLPNGGSYQLYQGGAIMYSPASGAQVSIGPIRDKWAATGFESGGLGYPTSDVVYGLKNGGAYQNYQGGAIMWSPTTGAHVSVGAIRGLWAETGFENGGLGYPTSDEVGGLKDGGVYQMYQGGAILWSPATGAHLSVGAIRSMWASTGFEAGRLGYPTTNEIPGPNGSVTQYYQGGSITWSPSTSYISYK